MCVCHVHIIRYKHRKCLQDAQLQQCCSSGRPHAAVSDVQLYLDLRFPLHSATATSQAIIRPFARVNVLQVLVLGGAYAAHSKALLEKLAQPGVRGLRPVLLLDPDVAGRQARSLLAAQLPQAWHAFVPSHLATAPAATR